MSNVQIANTDAQLAATLLSMNAIQKVAHIQLNDTQIKAAPTTLSFELASSIGGKILIPILGILVSKFSGGAYTNLGVDGYWDIETNNGGGIWSSRIADFAADSITAFTDMMSASNRITTLNSFVNLAITSLVGYSVSQLISDFQGNIVLTCYGSASNFTGGHAANTLDVYVHYFQLTV